METIGSKRSYALIWCMPNNDDDDVLNKRTQYLVQQINNIHLLLIHCVIIFPVLGCF